ncbi:fluoride efflux transporter CrcB [Labrys okinawensis]|uniref:fluoride efflux transporter CrcB n=1 Tax=Labrys okinawensis TaxID=346911 RepID=UPI0039BCA954
MSDSFTNTLLIAIGGALGSVARYWGGIWMAPYGQSLPWGTILINILGSFAITFFGTLTIASGRIPLADGWRLFFMVGICGGFTTFSSFSLQTFELLHMNMPGRALANIAASVLLCLAASAVGYYAATGINGGSQQTAQVQTEES